MRLVEVEEERSGKADCCRGDEWPAVVGGCDLDQGLADDFTRVVAETDEEGEPLFISDERDGKER